MYSEIYKLNLYPTKLFQTYIVGQTGQ